MRPSRAHAGLPGPVVRSLRKLGADISIARRRRAITAALLAERAFIARNTLARVERGDATVSLGIYASVLYALGLTERLAMLADPAHDAIGRDLDEDRLPRRVRMPKPARPPADGS